MTIKPCRFCGYAPERIIAQNDLAFVIKDANPVSLGHLLIIPHRHAVDYFSLNDDEMMAIHQLLHQQKQALLQYDPLIDGFNIGINCGEAAGQTIFHCHVHLIPRRKGDVDDPRGGIRHLIPGKGAY